MGKKLNYDDICIIPDVLTSIESRKECNCYDEVGFLPIFTAPMDTVIDESNITQYTANKIHTVIPRTVSLEKRKIWLNYAGNVGTCFVAFSLQEAKELFLKEKKYHFKFYGSHCICIDMANGHMQDLLDVCTKIKAIYGTEIIIMTGNIANPKTYIEYEKAGIDYCRCGIGGGSVCSTSSNTGIHFPYFSLIKEIYEIKQQIGGKCKIIADGNIKIYRDIQKALVYADYVMIGGLFNKSLESAGKTTYGKFYWNIRGYKLFRPLKTLLNYGKEVKREDYAKVANMIKNGEVAVWKKFYGMSTKQAQKAVLEGNGKKADKLKTAEGLVKYQKVEYTLHGWVENETDYLRSAMSYTNSRTLEEYKNSEWVEIEEIRYNN